ncbi:solute carrier family 13 member 2-like isoform X2 [Dreissena polymorpha]|uniref:solute carrier family 13 member 2-like isoform X2 n=1 Tax=Dreissena polymorpha TaxID=45954 RepID=UPI0022651D9E|nr:solute carrier family 13 member 2-like isoform X2 [Dreissena polymorpha]
MAILRTLWTLRTVLVIVLTPVLLSPLLVYGSKQGAAGFCLLLMAIYWLTEAFPIAITALLPVLLFPVTGIMTGKQVSATYINDSSMLFVGGLIMAVAIEHWNIHKRIALKILMVIGTEPNRLMLGMMLPAWFLSMWTSNIATSAMMMPIADALLHELQKGECELDANEHADEPFHASNHLSMTESQVNSELGSDSREVTEPCKEKAPSREHLQMAKALTISIAYSASIGGTTTLTGCASNIILKGMADQIFKEKRLDSGLSFGTWLVIGFPVSLIIFIAMFLWLIFYFRGCSCFTKTGKTSGKLRHFIKQEYISLGPIRFPEVMVISLFLLLVVLWVSRDLGGAGGWGNLFKSDYVTDSAAPTLVAALLFLIPANLLDFLKTKGRPVAVKPLLTWRAVNDKVPWGLFLLFGGGFALAQACKVSGLSESIRDALTVFQELPVWLTSFLVALITSMITEVVTNTATCTLVLPIISQLALGIGVNPLYLMIPTAVATSYAFMLPVATPPNAMVYSMGYFSISEMMRCGFILNLVSVLVLTLGVNTWGAQYFRLAHLPAEFITTTTTTTGYVSTMSDF